MSLKNLLKKTRISLDEAIYLARDLLPGRGPLVPEPRPLELWELEDRVLLSVVPAPVVPDGLADGDWPAVEAPLEQFEVHGQFSVDAITWEDARGAPNVDAAPDEDLEWLDIGASGHIASLADLTGGEQAEDQGSRRPEISVLDAIETRNLTTSATEVETNGARSLVTPATAVSDAVDVVLIDSQLPQSDILAQAVPAGDRLFLYGGSRDSAGDILARLTDWAQSNNTQLGSLSILAHAAPGSFVLGNQWITADTLDVTSADWGRLDEVLVDGGNVYLYGCNLVDPDGDGQRLMDRLAQLTGGDVFASDDLTGAGGDWVLEVASWGAEAETAAGLALSLDTELLESSGATLAWYNPAWGYRKQVTIDDTKVSGTGDLTDFPVLVNLTDLDFRDTGNSGHVGQADGGDFVFTSADGASKLDHEIESYDPTTGELVAWVRVPTLDYDDDTAVYVYYGNASAVDQWNPEGVWDSNFQGVWHLNEDQAGTGNTDLYQDSTSHNHHGDDQISATGQSGVVGDGQQLDGTDDRIQTEYILDPSSGNFTISLWFNVDVLASTKGDAEVLLSQEDGTGTGRSLLYVGSAADKLGTFLEGASANNVMAYDRGRLAEGLAADVIVFDYDRITDLATFAEPNRLSEGMKYVMVNGQIVLEDGKYTGQRPGRVLRGPGYRSDAAPPAVSSGKVDPRTASFDRMVRLLMEVHHVPGVALAVTDHGRLVHARGYGYADVTTREKVKPTSLFRIASLSKPITAVAVLQLVEKKQLGLNDKVFELLRHEPHLEEGRTLDERQSAITIRHLLEHRGGWDRDESFDAMFQSIRFAQALGVKPPAGPDEVIRCMLGQPLDFDPGQRYAYSNYGYCLLGRVIEEVTGKSYQDHVKKHVLAPLGIRSMRIGKTRPGGRQAGEVRYYDPARKPSVFAANLNQQVQQPYGGWYLEAMDSHGGWIASVVDLARFACAFDDPDHCELLGRKSIETMFARPPGSAGYEEDRRPKAVYYSCGWLNRVADNGKINRWHTGSLAGTAALLVRRHDGRNWAVLFNARVSPHASHLGRAIDGLVHQAVGEVSRWPDHDLFGDFR